jgi:hypothetical protein
MNSRRLICNPQGSKLADVRCERDQFGGIFASFCAIAGGPTNVDANIVAFAPTPFFKRLSEDSIALPTLWVLYYTRHEHADAPHPLPLLRPRRERPHGGAAKPRERQRSGRGQIQEFSARDFQDVPPAKEVRLSPIGIGLDLRNAHPPQALTLPLNSQDIGTSRWQLGGESTSAPSPDN